MLGKNRFHKLTTIITIAAIWCVYSTVAFAVSPDTAAEITVSGQVTVNGQPAVSNSTILSGATIVAGPGSSAVVSLGKTGRVEISADSTLTLRFSDNSIVGNLTSGKAKISNSAGVATTVTTKDTTVIADSGQSDSFEVQVECSHTHVDTTSGLVTMREGTNDKQVVAGSTAVAGNLAQKGCVPCLRPNSTPNVNYTGYTWLLAVAAGAAGLAIFLGTRKTDTVLTGSSIIVSPTR